MDDRDLNAIMTKDTDQLETILRNFDDTVSRMKTSYFILKWPCINRIIWLLFSNYILEFEFIHFRKVSWEQEMAATVESLICYFTGREITFISCEDIELCTYPDPW